MPGLVLVGVDDSATAREAARTAANLALGMDAALHVVSAFERHETKTVGSGSDVAPVATAEEARSLAEQIADELREITPAVTAGSALGKPQQVLVDEAERRQANLIVVGNRGMRGLGRVLGSVANSVAHHAPCDVYIAKTV
ncbi:universal stress protein [Gordonia sp. HNM0687]|uniref:Universal stress protein n=1 Tax=Gordonia mangrovi TaxID=2665643 RepID=A0A6L7GJC4_9ACTN|nr:universal stress protein [Gordonia mangrovi]MXP19994.1 universal stress protein [Gordonia mangrovi]UVF79390.1 universal stress protein [Gordonia mangrovi]